MRAFVIILITALVQGCAIMNEHESDSLLTPEVLDSYFKSVEPRWFGKSGRDEVDASAVSGSPQAAKQRAILRAKERAGFSLEENAIKTVSATVVISDVDIVVIYVRLKRSASD